MGIPTEAHIRLARFDRALGRAIARALAAAACAATLATLLFPTGTAADDRVVAPACPPGTSLATIEQAPGAVILLGTITAVAPGAGRVDVAVQSWYHRSVVPDLAAGVHPATIRVDLGSQSARRGVAAVTVPTLVGSRFLVAGTWAGLGKDVSVACGVFANADLPEGAAWLDRADAHYLAVPPSATSPVRLPLDDPRLPPVVAAAILVLAAMILGAVAQAHDPAPAV